MFKFDFEIEDQDEELSTRSPQDGAGESLVQSESDERSLVEYRLTEIVEFVADEISYSSIQVGDLQIPRRDLFDVRMQLIASEGQSKGQEKEEKTAIEFVDRPSDLVPRVYEGGLKTWECSLDLANYVAREYSNIRGKRVIELGCGTAMPTLALLQTLFNGPPPGESAQTTTVHLQDYNSSVLELVTLPNIILVWFCSSAAEAFRSTLPLPSPSPIKKQLPKISNLRLDSVLEEGEEEEADTPSNPPTTESQPRIYDLSAPGDLIISTALRSAFLDALQTYKIDIRFFSGPWSEFHPHVTSPYDLVLTSETIYQPTSLPSLVRLLQHATGTGICLVAAKLVYFGVGGGIKEFERALGGGDVNGRIETVWEHKEGVGRCILRVYFDQ